MSSGGTVVALCVFVSVCVVVVVCACECGEMGGALATHV